MGMYDELRCHYPLPVEGANARDYQTKDTPCQYLNHYEITTDGVLRHKVIGPLTRETWNRDVLPLVQQLQQAARP